MAILAKQSYDNNGGNPPDPFVKSEDCEGRCKEAERK